MYYYRPYIQNDIKISYGETNSFVAVFDPEAVSFTSYMDAVLSFDKMTFSCVTQGSGSFRVDTYGYVSRNITKQTDWSIVEYSGIYPELYVDTLKAMIPGDLYEVKVFVEPAGYGKVYSEVHELKINTLQVITGSYLLLNSTTVRLNGQIILGSLPVNEHGFCYSYTNSNPDLNEQYVSLGVGSDQQFTANVSSLLPNVTYCYRAYGIEDNRITYGEIEQFIISE